MKPFDLQKALAGDPVITKYGKKVEQLHLFKVKICFPLVCCIDGELEFYDENGCRDNSNDQWLFMAPKKKKLWIAVAKRDYEYICSNPHSSLEKLKENGWYGYDYHFVQIEIDEE